jgi:hypothetical protein
MLVPAVFFWQVVLAIHVIIVVAAFGVVVAYPVLTIAADRIDRRSAPLVHRVRGVIGRSLVNPGLLVVLAAGIYLASDLHQWHEFYVQWGVAAIVVLGGIEGGFVIRQSVRLAELAERDIAAAGGGDPTWSHEYVHARGRADQINAVMAVLVLVTVFFMVVQ